MSRYPKLFQCILAISFCCIFVGSCSTTATIYKKDGTAVNGWIESSDSSSIFLEGGKEIKRSDIKNIDHPGNVAIIISAIPAIYGIALSAAVLSDEGHMTGGHLIFGSIGLVSAIIGVPVNIWGWYTWGRSRSAASPPDEAYKPRVAPVALFDGRQEYWGLGMSWSW